jgi:hypothetical protein
MPKRAVKDIQQLKGERQIAFVQVAHAEEANNVSMKEKEFQRFLDFIEN